MWRISGLNIESFERKWPANSPITIVNFDTLLVDILDGNSENIVFDYMFTVFFLQLYRY